MKPTSGTIIMTTTGLFMLSYGFFGWVFNALSWHALASASALTYIVVSSWEKRLHRARHERTNTQKPKRESR